MKKKLYIIVCIMILIVFAVTYAVKGATTEEILQERQQKREELNTQIKEKNTELEEVQGEISSVTEQLQKLNEKIANYQQEIAVLNVQVSQLEITITKAKQDLQVAENNYQKQKKLLEQRIVAMYEAGQTVYLDVLLASKSIESFISSYYVLSEISKYDRELLESVSKEKARIALENEQLIQQQNELKTLMTNKEKTAVTLKNTKIVRDNYLAQLSDKEREIQEEVEQFEKEMEKLEYEILNVSLASLGEDYAGGEMAWPTPGYKTVTSKYGMRMHPIFKVYRLHTGTDIGAPLGADIIAVNDGVVTLAAYSSSYGNYLMVDHGGGVVTLYAHASKLCVSEGDKVQKGEVIAKVGSTGWSTGPHLHFEVRMNGKTVDSLPYITSQVTGSTNHETAIEENNITIENNINAQS